MTGTPRKCLPVWIDGVLDNRNPPNHDHGWQPAIYPQDSVFGRLARGGGEPHSGPGAMNIMRRLLGIVCCLSLALCLTASAALAARAPKVPRSAAATLVEQQDSMIRQCNLTAEQQEKLKEKFQLKRAALEKWQQANAAKLTAAEEAAKTAQKGTDDAAKRKANGDLKTLVQDRAQATAEADKAILAVLSPEQQAAWAGFQLAESMLPRYKKANLGADQSAKVKACCVIAAKDLAGFTGDDRKDKQGRSTVQKCLKWAIDNVILTPEQREIVVKRPAAK
jgi:Spy/CpxP family protein refolding chaperone